MTPETVIQDTIITAMITGITDRRDRAALMAAMAMIPCMTVMADMMRGMTDTAARQDTAAVNMTTGIRTTTGMMAATMIMMMATAVRG